MVALSDGTHIEPINAFMKAQRKLARLQSCLAKKVKFSSDWSKQFDPVSKWHR